MGELILCRGTLAAMPYFLESISVNIYSLEELAWGMEHRAELTGLDIYSESFVSWVEQELKLKKEGKILRDLLEQKAGQVVFTDTVLLMTAYSNEERRMQIHRRLKEYEAKSPFEREIMKADRLLAAGKYKSSIKAYEPLTGHIPEGKKEELLLGRVWNNMGTAYARLFLFERAEDCYQKAYAKNQDQETAKAVLLAHACAEENVGERSEPDDPEFLKQWQEIQEQKQNGNTQMYEKLLLQMIGQWKQEYRKAAEDR